MQSRAYLFPEPRRVYLLVLLLLVVAEGVAERQSEVAVAGHGHAEPLPLEVYAGVCMRGLEYVAAIELERGALVLKEPYLQRRADGT